MVKVVIVGTGGSGIHGWWWRLYTYVGGGGGSGGVLVDAEVVEVAVVTDVAVVGVAEMSCGDILCRGKSSKF